MNRHSTALFATAMCAFLVAPSRAAHAADVPSSGLSGTGRKDSTDPPPEARERFQRGLELYGDGDYPLALIEFKRAYEISPSYRIMYNIGQVELQLNHYAKALAAFRTYLSEGGQEIPADRRTKIEQQIAAASARTATLTINVDTPDAEVFLDDLPIGHAPLAALVVDAGTRKVSASRPGYLPVSKVVTLAGQDSVTVSLALPVAGSGASSVTVVSNPTNYPAIVGWSSAAALGVGAILTGVMAMSANSKLKDLSNRRDVSKQELQDKESERATFSLASDILAGGTLVAAGVALYFTIKGVPSGAEKRRPPVAVRVNASPTWAGLSGVF